MKRIVVFLAVALFFSSPRAFATISFSDNFNSYVNGNLAGLSQDALGQGTWRQTGTVATSPIQVNNGTVVLFTGQDAYAPLTSTISITSGSTFYIGATVDLTAAQATGDYFLHWTPTVGNSTIFPERLFAKSSGAGFVFGYDGASGGTVNYSSTMLSFNTSYRIVLAYTGVNGALNDTFALYVNPTDTSVEGNNTAYLTSGYVGTGAESTTVAGINLRQGGASSAPSVILDNLTVATLFSDAAPVPEPSALALGLVGGLAGLVALRRKR
ncbi:MAG: PEP-CTERM sorting domain-containing protein [Verrucomicrobiota bacterium]